MVDWLMRNVVRAKFRATPRRAATMQIGRCRDGYLAVAQALGEKGRSREKVPKLMGVDEDMRDWSLFMILEHNAMVNQSIAQVVEKLAVERKPELIESVDPKTAFNPDSAAGAGQVDAFRQSVEDYLKRVEAIESLRPTPTYRHPVFAELDAHGWHCMFSIHLQIHLNQANHLQKLLS